MKDPYGSARFERARELVDRRRLLIGLGVAVAVVLIAAIPGVLTGGGGAKRVRATGVAQGGPATTVFEDGAVSPELGAPMATVPPPSTTTTQPASVLGTSFTQVPTTTTPPKSAGKSAPSGPAPAPAPAPSPAPACRNSSDPACGQFRWDPDPGQNQPMTGQLTFDPPNPKAGDTVTFHIVASDPDAKPVAICNAQYGGSEGGYVCDPAPRMNPSSCPAQYGPWTPPARQPGNLDTFDPHTYHAAGAYQVSYDLGSAMGDCNNPYASGLTLKTTVVVS